MRWESLLLSFYADLDLSSWWVSVPGCCEEPSLASWRSVELWQMEDRGFSIMLTRPTPCSRPEFCTVSIRNLVVGYDSGLAPPYGPWLGWPNPYWRDP